MGVRIVHSGCGYVSIPRGDQTYLRLLLAAGDRLVPTKPLNKALIHSDQGSQFTSMDWSSFLRTYNLEHSMNQRGDCHYNVVAESFFLKRSRRKDQAPELRNPCRCKTKHVRLHRNILQSKTQTGPDAKADQRCKIQRLAIVWRRKSWPSAKNRNRLSGRPHRQSLTISFDRA